MKFWHISCRLRFCGIMSTIKKSRVLELLFNEDPADKLFLATDKMSTVLKSSKNCANIFRLLGTHILLDILSVDKLIQNLRVSLP